MFICYSVSLRASHYYSCAKVLRVAHLPYLPLLLSVSILYILEGDGHRRCNCFRAFLLVPVLFNPYVNHISHVFHLALRVLPQRF